MAFKHIVLLLLAVLAIVASAWIVWNLKAHQKKVNGMMLHNRTQLHNIDRMNQELEKSQTDIFRASALAAEKAFSENGNVIDTLQGDYHPSVSSMVQPSIVDARRSSPIRLDMSDRAYELHHMQNGRRSFPCTVLVPSAKTVGNGYFFTVTIPTSKRALPTRTLTIAVEDVENDTLTHINLQNAREQEEGTEYTIDHSSTNSLRVLLYCDNQTHWFVHVSKE